MPLRHAVPLFVGEPLLHGHTGATLRIRLRAEEVGLSWPLPEALNPVLRQEHKAGEKTFVDYAGQTVPVLDAESGEIRQAQIFWIASHQRMFAFFGGVTT